MMDNAFKATAMTVFLALGVYGYVTAGVIVTLKAFGTVAFWGAVAASLLAVWEIIADHFRRMETGRDDTAIQRAVSVENQRISIERQRLGIEADRSRIEISRMRGRVQEIHAPGIVDLSGAAVLPHWRPKYPAASPKAEGSTVHHPAIGYPAERSVFEHIAGEPFVALVGGQGSGKTTILKSLVAQAGTFLLIDPHGDIHPEAIGAGRDYSAVGHALSWVHDEITRRYSRGIQHPELFVFIDEFTLLRRNVQGFDDIAESMLTESRKAGIRIVAGSHSRRADIWGLRGKYDLSASILWVNLKRDLSNGRRIAEIEKADEKCTAYIPDLSQVKRIVSSGIRPDHGHGHGHGHGDTAISGSQSRSRDHDTVTKCLPVAGGADDYAAVTRPVAEYASETDRDLCERYRAGEFESLNKAAKYLFGYANGKKVKAVQGILSRYNLL